MSHVPHEVFEDLVLERREPDFFAVDGHLLFVGVQFEASGHQHVFADFHAAKFRVPADLGLHPGHEFQRVEGLRDVVVRPEAEPRDLVGVLGLRREQDDRDVVGLPDLQHGGEAVHAGHHDVEHHAVHLVLFQQSESLDAVHRRQDLVPFLGEVDANGVEDRSVVVANQNRVHKCLRVVLFEIVLT